MKKGHWAGTEEYSQWRGVRIYEGKKHSGRSDIVFGRAACPRRRVCCGWNRPVEGESSYEL